MTPLRVDVWSDIACPWCWVGKRHLEQAAELAVIEIDVHWHAFELDPGAPKHHDPAVDYVERLAQKYGVPVARAQTMIDRMTSVGTKLGLEFRFDRVRPTNTFDAHRLLAWAAESGKQSALKERLFEAYMRDGQSIADHEALVRAAESVGLDAERANAVLNSSDRAQDVRADERQAAELGVHGVPFFVVEERLAVQGAQPPEALAQVLARARDETAAAASAKGDETSDEHPDGCTAEGCEVPTDTRA